jgi:hypothetical protein
MKIVNEHLNYPKAELISPNTKGYLHIGLEVDSSLQYLRHSERGEGPVLWANRAERRHGLKDLIY